MKQLFKTLIALCMVMMMTFAVTTAVSAEEASSNEGEQVYSISIYDDGSKAYELVWKFKSENGHMYKRRWNKTMNEWYDPAWILVY